MVRRKAISDPLIPNWSQMPFFFLFWKPTLHQTYLWRLVWKSKKTAVMKRSGGESAVTGRFKAKVKGHHSELCVHILLGKQTLTSWIPPPPYILQTTHPPIHPVRQTDRHEFVAMTSTKKTLTGGSPTISLDLQRSITVDRYIDRNRWMDGWTDPSFSTLQKHKQDQRHVKVRHYCLSTGEEMPRDLGRSSEETTSKIQFLSRLQSESKGQERKRNIIKPVVSVSLND